MKRRLIILALLFSVAVAAQQLAWQDEPEAGAPSSEASEAAGEPGEDGEAGQAQPGAQQEAPEQASKPPPDDAELTVAEGVEDSDEIVEDFDPDEEISEDYPVPLPSDI